jgi:hypothetical protein
MTFLTHDFPTNGLLRNARRRGSMNKICESDAFILVLLAATAQTTFFEVLSSVPNAKFAYFRSRPRERTSHSWGH